MLNFDSTTRIYINIAGLPIRSSSNLPYNFKGGEKVILNFKSNDILSSQRPHPVRVTCEVEKDCFVSKETYGMDSIYVKPDKEYSPWLKDIFFGRREEIRAEMIVPNTFCKFDVLVHALPNNIDEDVSFWKGSNYNTSSSSMKLNYSRGRRP